MDLFVRGATSFVEMVGCFLINGGIFTVSFTFGFTLMVQGFFFFISNCLFVVFFSCIWTSNWLVGNRKAVPLLVFFRT